MNKIYIIAEAGVNHNGSLKTAKELINKAAFAGADAVKNAVTIMARNFKTWSASVLETTMSSRSNAVKTMMRAGDDLSIVLSPNCFRMGNISAEPR